MTLRAVPASSSAALPVVALVALLTLAGVVLWAQLPQETPQRTTNTATDRIESPAQSISSRDAPNPKREQTSRAPTDAPSEAGVQNDGKTKNTAVRRREARIHSRPKAESPADRRALKKRRKSDAKREKELELRRQLPHPWIPGDLTLEGRVISKPGIALREVRAELKPMLPGLWDGTPGALRPRPLQVRSDGSFACDGLPSGTLVLSVSAAQHAAESVTFSLKKGESARVEVKLSAELILVGHVRGRGNQPIVDATIKVAEARTRSGKEGAFRISAGCRSPWVAGSIASWSWPDELAPCESWDRS